MSGVENNTENTNLAEDDVGKPTIWVSFCPDLGLYHVHREVEGEDPTDSKFTRADLRDIVDGMIESAQVVEAQQLATLCAWGRLFGHKVVVFYTSGIFRVFNPEPPDDLEEEESEDMRAFHVEWKKAHPTDDSVPTVEAYARLVRSPRGEPR
jgi:hypothetical protein